MITPAVAKALQDILHGGHVPNLPPQTPGYAQVSGTVPIGQPAGQRFMENGIQAQPAPSMPTAPTTLQSNAQPSLSASLASGNPLTMAIATALQAGQNATDPGTYRKSADAQSQQATDTYNRALTKPKPQPSFSLGTKDLIAPLAMLVGKLLFHSRDSDLSQFAGAYLGERQRGAAEKDAYNMDQYNREQDAAKVQYGADMDKVKRTMDFMEDIRKAAAENYKDDKNFQQQLGLKKLDIDADKASKLLAAEGRRNSAWVAGAKKTFDALPEGAAKIRLGQIMADYVNTGTLLNVDEANRIMAENQTLDNKSKELDNKKKEFDLSKMPERYKREVEKFGVDLAGKRLDNIWQGLQNKSYSENQAFKRMMIAIHVQNFNRGVANDKLDQWYKQTKPILDNQKALEGAVEQAKIKANAAGRELQTFEAQHFVNNEWDSEANAQVYETMKRQKYLLDIDFYKKKTEMDNAVDVIPEPPQYDIKQIDKTSIPKSWGKLPDVMIGGPSGGGELKPNNAPIPKMVTPKATTPKPKPKAGGKLNAKPKPSQVKAAKDYFGVGK